MNSRELVQRTLAFDRPARVPRQLWVLPWAAVHYPAELRQIQERFPDDLVSAPGFCQSLPTTHGDPYRRGRYIDEWGCVFENLQEGVIGEVKVPLLASWDRLERLRVPAEWLSIDRAQIDGFCRESDRYVLSAACPRIFERLQFLRGTPNLLMDLLERPPELRELIDRLHHFYLQLLNSQLFCMGLDQVSSFAGQITFWGELDRQRILPEADPTALPAIVDDMRAALYRQGGVIAQCEFGPGARPENVTAFFSAWEGAASAGHS